MLSEVIDHGWLQVDELIEAFERAWANDAAPEIMNFLPVPDHPQRRETLLELIRVDLELRWQHGCPITLDDYRIKFPQLLSNSESFSLIAFEEFRARRNSGESVMPAEYECRFGIRTDRWPMMSVKRKHPEPFASTKCVAVSPRPSGLNSSGGKAFPEVGTELLSFLLESELGRGAFSRVYLAKQRDLANRLVVLKISAESFAEADKIAQLQHANIVPIYSVHRLGNLSAVCIPYFGAATLADVVSEIHGLSCSPQSGRAIVETLKACARRTQLKDRRVALNQDAFQKHALLDDSDWDHTKGSGYEGRLKSLSDLSYVEAVLWIGAKLADGLSHAHERGILHCDLKPANVLLADDGEPMILDFNLSEDLKQSINDREMHVGGTISYMAPEQIYALQHRTRSGDARSDVYSLGVILFELLSGRYPFPIRKGSSLNETLTAMLHDRKQSPQKVRSINPEATPAVESIIQRCLCADLLHRYQSAAELHEDLERHLKQLPLRYAREPSLVERARKWTRRHSRLTSIIGVLLLVLIISFAFQIHQKRLRVRAAEAEIRDLMQAGQQALDDDNAEVAHGRILSAWMKVQAEPSLIDDQLYVAGWLEHSRKAVVQRKWRQRVPPREFDDRRDEALLLSLLLEQPAEQQLSIAREAIHAATSFTIPGDPGWTHEREQLMLVEVDLIELESGPEQALKHLDATSEFSSRLFYQRRAVLLQQLGRSSESEQVSHKANMFPPDEAVDEILNGIARARRREFDAALQNFEHVLDRQPDLFIARLFQAICFLKLNRPQEAKVALTACIAQRPSFMWSHFFRSQVSAALGDEKAAIVDLQRVLGMKPSAPLERAALDKMQLVRSQLKFP